MTTFIGRGLKRFAALAAAYLHAVVVLLSLAALPVEPYSKSFETIVAIGVIDADLDESVAEAELTGGDVAWWLAAGLNPLGQGDGQRLFNGPDALRGGCCSRAFHARAPPSRIG